MLIPPTPTIVRPFWSKLRSYQGCNAAISLASSCLRPPEPTSAFSRGKLTGQTQPDISSGRLPSASSGKSSKTGPCVRASRPSAVSSTRRWNSGSSGAPMGRPKSNGTQSARGGFICSVCSRTRLISTVAMPSSSINRASPPTARVQFGQTGVKKTALTPSSFKSPAKWRALSSSASGSVAPMKE